MKSSDIPEIRNRDGEAGGGGGGLTGGGGRGHSHTTMMVIIMCLRACQHFRFIM